MVNPDVRYADLRAGRFRFLEWPAGGDAPAVLFLHGLTAVADVWGPTYGALARPLRGLALDQRGHGESPRGESIGGYAVGRFVQDVGDFIGALQLDRPHLVGHSMGARVAMVTAARRPELIRSVTMVDIGPEQWAANWRDSIAGFERQPERFESAEAALAWAFGERQVSAVDRELFLARLRSDGQGGLMWKASVPAMSATVRRQRSRSYWSEWDSLRLPAMFIRAGRSNEVRAEVAERMRSRNAAVRYVELPGVPHNIPLRDPAGLALALGSFWDDLS